MRQDDLTGRERIARERIRCADIALHKLTGRRSSSDSAIDLTSDLAGVDYKYDEVDDDEELHALRA